MTATDKAREAKDNGAHLLERNKPEAALKEFQTAVKLVPDDLAARKKVAEISARLGQKAEAISQYQHLAGRYAADGQLAQAIAVSKLILQLDPGHTQTQETLAHLYSEKGDASGAAAWRVKIPPSMAGALQAPAADDVIEVQDSQIIEVEVDAAALPKAPLFSELPRELFLALLHELEMRPVPAGATVVREGEQGQSMYLLAQGKVDVVRGLGTPQAKTVASMAEGTFFGEICLLADVPRLASIVAASDCVVLEVTRAMLGGLQKKHPALEPLLQHFYRERLLANLLRSSPLFQPFDDEARRRLVDRFALRKAGKGEVLVREDEPGKALFVLLRGRCDVFHTEAGKEHAFPAIGEGAVFGEIALLGATPKLATATATVRAAEGCLLLSLDAEAFRSQVLSNETARKALEGLKAERLERSTDLVEKLWFENPAWV